VPAFEKEIDRRPGKTRTGKDITRYVFKNGSIIDNLAASEKSRGKRRQAGLLEECVGIDGKILQEVLVPTMNVSRRCKDGTVQESETPNKS
jgi:cytidylate kinase